jgi:hypothetical protein
LGIELILAIANKATLNRDDWKHTWEVVHNFVCGGQLKRAAIDSMPKAKIAMMKWDLVLCVPILQPCVSHEALKPNCTVKLQFML